MPTVKAVIDTSVMVSVAFAKEGLTKELRDMIAESAFRLVISKEIMAERGHVKRCVNEVRRRAFG